MNEAIQLGQLCCSNENGLKLVVERILDFAQTVVDLAKDPVRQKV